jgi:hypothetical protein
LLDFGLADFGFKLAFFTFGLAAPLVRDFLLAGEFFLALLGLFLGVAFLLDDRGFDLLKLFLFVALLDADRDLLLLAFLEELLLVFLALALFAGTFFLAPAFFLAGCFFTASLLILKLPLPPTPVSLFSSPPSTEAFLKYCLMKQSRFDKSTL